MEFLDSLISNFEAYWYWEPIATLTALVYVYLASKANRFCFIFGLISSLILIYICYDSKLYFDTGINAYYVLMSFYGWFAWKKKTNEKQLTIQRIPRSIFTGAILLGAVLSFFLALLVDRFSDPQLPYIDAFTTVFALFATWMVIKKYIENWLVWIVVDSIAAGMYFYKELYFIGILYIIYTLMAVYGYIKWKQIIQHQ